MLCAVLSVEVQALLGGPACWGWLTQAAAGLQHNHNTQHSIARSAQHSQVMKAPTAATAFCVPAGSARDERQGLPFICGTTTAGVLGCMVATQQDLFFSNDAIVPSMQLRRTTDVLQTPLLLIMSQSVHHHCVASAQPLHLSLSSAPQTPIQSPGAQASSDIQIACNCTHIRVQLQPEP